MNRVSYRLTRLLFLAAFLVGCGTQRDLPGAEDIAPSAVTQTATFRIQAPTDDAEELFGRPTVVGQTSLDLGVYNNSKRRVGFRFDGLTIPKGAQIDAP